MKNVIYAYPYGSHVNIQSMLGTFIIIGVLIRGNNIQYELSGPIGAQARHNFYVYDTEISGLADPDTQPTKIIGFKNDRSKN